MEAFRATALAQAQPAELARVVLDVGEAALVAALGEAVGERNRVALGAAVHERAGDEQDFHGLLLFLFMRSKTAPYVTASTTPPATSRSKGRCPAKKTSVTA